MAKRVTSLDVARRAGVSRTTVSFVLNNAEGMQISEETRKRVLEAAGFLGYVPDAAAQALASGRSKTIGLLLARRPDVIASDMFLTAIMEVLVREVNRHGMRLLLEVVEDFEDREFILKLVRSNSIDGILYSGPGKSGIGDAGNSGGSDAVEHCPAAMRLSISTAAKSQALHPSVPSGCRAQPANVGSVFKTRPRIQDPIDAVRTHQFKIGLAVLEVFDHFEQQPHPMTVNFADQYFHNGG